MLHAVAGASVTQQLIVERDGLFFRYHKAESVVSIRLGVHSLCLAVMEPLSLSGLDD